mmetsp:Transcript_3805/g.5823  ORF Transcript_3805/g.5823 Transcript_3805/m.5823 type:complete len:103 (-) Transcript_3805:226-534(-)
METEIPYGQESKNPEKILGETPKEHTKQQDVGTTMIARIILTIVMVTTSVSMDRRQSIMNMVFMMERIMSLHALSFFWWCCIFGTCRIGTQQDKLETVETTW